MIVMTPADAAGLTWTQAQGAEHDCQRAWVELPCCALRFGRAIFSVPARRSARWTEPSAERKPYE